MNKPKVSILILNWNGWHDTIECLESVYRITYPNYDVIVIDNDSKDDSIEKIKEYANGKIKIESKFLEHNPANKPIRIIEYNREETEAEIKTSKDNLDLPYDRKLIIIKNEINYGFAEGNNIGIRYALKALDPKYILLLNNDTVVDAEFLGELVKVAETNEKIGVVGSLIYFYDSPMKIQVIGGKINMWTGRRSYITKTINYNKNHVIEVDCVSGASLLIKKEVIENVGLLDKEYFVYVEDVDWCYRIKQKGYIILSSLDSIIWHKGSKSTGGGYDTNTTVLYYISRNGFLFMRKNAEIYHLPSFIIISGYYFIKRLFIIAIKHPEKAKFMVRGILSTFKQK